MLILILSVRAHGLHFGASRLFRIPTLGVCFLVLSSGLSLFVTPVLTDDVIKCSGFIIAFTMMLQFVFVVVQFRLTTVNRALILMAISATCHSIVVIVQAEFGLFKRFLADSPHGVEDWTRFNGFAEHPIEAGSLSAFGVLLCLSLISAKRLTWVWTLCMAANLVSLRYSASLTAVLSVSLGLLTFSIISRKPSILLSLVAMLGFSTVLVTTMDRSLLLSSRLDSLLSTGLEYKTLQARQLQWSSAIDEMSAVSVVLGKGYDNASMPDKLDIHNALLSALYHLGVFGALSQICLLAFVLGTLTYSLPAVYKGVFVSLVLVFLATYLTGPSICRRTLWVPVMLMTCFARASRQLRLISS